MVATAIIGSAVIGAGTSLFGSSQQSHSAQQAINFQKQMFDTTKGELQPFINFGQGQLGALSGMLSGDPGKAQSTLESLPGYQFTQTQGLKAVQNSAAARGLGTSGAALKGAATYATGLANSTFGDQYNRLLNAATLGSNSASALGGFATQTGANVGNNYINQGNALAAGTLGAGNSLSGALTLWGLLNNSGQSSQGMGGGSGGSAPF